MKIALIGATGNVGQRITAEAVSRGHQVTAIARNIGGLGASDFVRVTTIQTLSRTGLKTVAPHGIALDSRGDIYLGEVGVTDWKTSFPDTPMPPEVRVSRCLQKLEKI